jgi:hypothetical protein
MPAIAAIDNETLDHLLSVVDDARNLTGVRALSKPGPRDQRWDARVAGDGMRASPERCVSARRIAGGPMPSPWPGASGDQALQASAALSAVRASFLVL